MEQKYSATELEEVLNLWHQTQDTDIISKEMEMTIDKIEDMLNYLQRNGEIDDWDPTNQEIEESVDSETSKILKLHQFDVVNKDKYFFTKKNIGKFYDTHIFMIDVKDMEMLSSDNAVKINCVVSVKNKDYNFFIYYNVEEEVFYGSPNGESEVKEMREELGDNMERFDQITMKILGDLLPEDFWERRSREN
jgi:hypothetical protein